MADEEKQMTFWEHLDELRKVLFKSAVAVVVVMAVVFSFKNLLFDNIILAPTNGNFLLYRLMDKALALMGLPLLDEFHLELINIDMAAQFFIHISTSFYIALVLTVPYIVYQLWSFVKPALYENERKAVTGAFSFAGILFYLGLLVGYFLIFPLTIRFLGTYQVSDTIQNTISLQSYINMFVWLIMIIGIVFEMPSLAAILGKFGILTKDFLKKYRKHAFVVLMVVAALITPSGDPFTLMAVGLPLYALYELSIIVCKPKSQE